ncbi:MAG: PAS domain-containing protein [Planctomycetaceae bacterium]|nr:PAS domain-containing protein [Planctomycetaceae bacterium]
MKKGKFGRQADKPDKDGLHVPRPADILLRRHKVLFLHNPFLRYAFALAMVAAALLLRDALRPLAQTGLQFVTVFPSVMIVAIFAGRWPAVLFSVIASPLAAHYFSAQFNAGVLVSALLVILTGLIAGWLAERLHASLDKSQEDADALAQSEASLRLAYQAANIGAFEWNMATGENSWTHELEAMYGLAPGAFAKTLSAWKELVYPDDRAAVKALIDRAFDTGQPVDGEWRVQWPDGSLRWLFGRFQLFKDASGKPLRLSGVNMDITERKQAEEALRRSEERFRVAQELSRLCRNLFLTHDLRANCLSFSKDL